MAIEFVCSGCSNTLRVPDEHAGKHARCPQCSSVNPIPNVENDVIAFPPLKSEPDEPFGQAPTKPAEPPYATPTEQPQIAYPQSPPPVYETANPYVPPAHSPSRHAGHYQPHRAGTIFALGILAIFCNIMLIPGILAWVLGNADLKEMKAGRMDPSGRGLTTAGMVMGIVMCSLYALMIVLNVVFGLLGIAAGVAGF